MHKYVWLSLVVVACSSQSAPIDGELLEIDVTADQPLDQITLILGDEGHDGGSGPLTPGLIAAGQAADTSITQFRSRPQVVTLDAPTQTQHFELAEPISFSGPLELLALGYRRDAGNNLVLVSAGTLRDVEAEASASKSYSLSISAALVPSIETWGGTAKLCARVSGEKAYFVDPQDVDCDGFPTAVDCNDEAFCDPSDPSAAAQAACTATSCEPCLDTTTGCTLGSHAVCHDGGTVTCDAGGGCGPAICLPGDSCQINCAQPWPMTDPTSCLEAAWRSAAESAGAQHCQLPTTHSQFGSQTCPAGSTISVALPFTGCTSPQVAIADKLDYSFTATVTAPCTLAVTLDPTTLVLGVMEVLATVETSTTTASVRLSLDPTDGPCTADGACDVAPAASSCQL